MWGFQNKNSNFEGGKRIFGVESKNNFIYLFEMYKPFIVIDKTFVGPKHSVYIL